MSGFFDTISGGLNKIVDTAVSAGAQRLADEINPREDVGPATVQAVISQPRPQPIDGRTAAENAKSIPVSVNPGALSLPSWLPWAIVGGVLLIGGVFVLRRK